MRAQNEPPETVVRLVRGEIDGEPTDVPGAYRVERVDEGASRRGASGRRAAPPSSPGSPSARGRASGARPLRGARRQGDAARAARSTAVEMHAGARARAGGECGAARRRERHASSARTRSTLPPELDGFDRALVDAPCSGLGVLAARPDLRWRAKPLPELQLDLLRAAAERVRPGGTIVYSVCTINADENEAVVDAIGPRARPLGDEWPEFRAPDAAGVPADAAARATARPASSSPGFGGTPKIARVPLADWIRTVEVEPSLYAADFSRLGDQIDVLMRAGARIFHFDVGDGHFVPPITIGPIVLESIAPHVHDAGGRVDCHLMVDNPRAHFAAFARGRRRQRHRSTTRPSTTCRRSSRRPGARACRSGSPSTRRPTPEDADAAARRRRPRPLHEHPPRLLAARSSCRTRSSGSASCRGAASGGCYVQVDGGIGPRTSRGVHDAGRDLLVAGTSIFGARGPAARLPPARSKPWREPCERALELAERGRGTTHPNPSSAPSSSATARSSARAGTRRKGQAACRGASRSPRRASRRAARRFT